MKSSFYRIVISALVFAFFIDFLIARIIFFTGLNETGRYAFIVFHLITSLTFYITTLNLLRSKGKFRENILRNRHYGASGMLILFYVPKLIVVSFNLMDELFWLGRWLTSTLFHTFSADFTKIYPVTTVGAFIGAVVFVAILFGILNGKFLFQVRHVHLSSPHFPKKLNEFRLVQISDIHIGSFRNHKRQFDKAMEMVNRLNPDIICFTGDLVNIFAEEAESFLPSLQKLHATYGKFAILGNHDYGEYYPWNSEKEQMQNLEALKRIITDGGFKLLLNEKERIGDSEHSFVLAGVENWGLPPFPQYGDLKKAITESKPNDFIVLLSHDPSHWDAEIKNHPNIFLTLSGHTHAMQFGVAVGNWRWSPVKWRYKKWAGLYSENHQYLYVNKGLGFIGFPGRVGMYPEITLFHLTSEAKPQTTSNL